ncbi:dTDP-glucose 4,6-dehydratase [Pseudozobellia thermophila]|uniref:dTDP-glucose 4,6-dehydratase n=1 Tax=Pseudozobellia thermophila TaxID=192903 RepID=A0A1M6BL91_9FLAO|nr:dTDP-glucose 4,6-dehydratase [Pseudozobellia thermophila]SHI49471.1 dTDP-glucose 4,6-dehydratase [Pseudozobellia thermophila]
MARKTILVTGGAGFIGSNFIPYFLSGHHDVKLVNLDKLTYAGNLDNLVEVQNNDRYGFVQGDICDKDLVESLFDEHQFSAVIHFAAESHVDNSISGPDAFIKTNINGTFTLLEAARNCWLEAVGRPRAGFENSRFVHISTDEVYGSLGKEGYFTEESPYRPNSPYSASKASSDFLARSYYHTYGLNVLVSNCSNNYGPKQHGEKLIPTIIKKALQGEPIPIYGDGKNVRDWLYVLDHCTGINKVFAKGQPGQTYVIGGNNEADNLSIASKVCAVLDAEYPKERGSYSEQITFVSDRPGHDFRYAIDATKIKRDLGWKPETDFDSGLKKTVAWYLEKFKNEK